MPACEGVAVLDRILRFGEFVSVGEVGDDEERGGSVVEENTEGVVHVAVTGVAAGRRGRDRRCRFLCEGDMYSVIRLNIRERVRGGRSHYFIINAYLSDSITIIRHEREGLVTTCINGDLITRRYTAVWSSGCLDDIRLGLPDCSKVCPVATIELGMRCSGGGASFREDLNHDFKVMLPGPCGTICGMSYFMLLMGSREVAVLVCISDGHRSVSNSHTIPVNCRFVITIPVECPNFSRFSDLKRYLPKITDISPTNSIGLKASDSNNRFRTTDDDGC